MTRIFALIVSSIMLFYSTVALSDRSFHDLYPEHEIRQDSKRLHTAITKMYRAMRVKLTADERRVLDRVEFKSPMPKKGDFLLDFYATPDNNNPVLFTPVLSLKSLEDLTTAMAWLQVNNYSHSSIDLYYAMLRYRDKQDFPGGRIPPILEALGIPKDAWKLPRVDKLSLRLRNNAFAFILFHELGHIYYKHKGYDQITKKQARLDEIESDQFAVNIMARDNAIPVGGFLFFQALVYNFTHRGEFKTDSEWEDYMHRRATHPLSTTRMKNIIAHARRSARDQPPLQQSIWLSIVRSGETMVKFVADRKAQKCMKIIAQKAPFSILKPSRTHVPSLAIVQKYCRSVVRE